MNILYTLLFLYSIIVTFTLGLGLSIYYYNRHGWFKLCRAGWSVDLKYSRGYWDDASDSKIAFQFTKGDFKDRTLKQALELQRIIETSGSSIQAKQLLETVTIEEKPKELTFQSVVEEAF